jgi:hypothetical protein
MLAFPQTQTYKDAFTINITGNKCTPYLVTIINPPRDAVIPLRSEATFFDLLSTDGVCIWGS